MESRSQALSFSSLGLLSHCHIGTRSENSEIAAIPPNAEMFPAALPVHFARRRGEGSGCRDAYHFAQETYSWKLSLLATGSRVGDVRALVQLVQIKRGSPPPSTCTLVNDRHLGPPGSLRLTPLKQTSVCGQKTTAVARVELTTERRKKLPCRWTRFSINHDPHRQRGQAY